MKIIHIGQAHKSSVIRYQHDNLYIALSQFRVAQAIKTNPHYPVLSEGLAENLTISNQSVALKDYIKKVFPQGFPSNFEELNEEQHKILQSVGGATILFYLGDIPTVYAANHQEVDRAAAAILESENPDPDLNKTLLFTQREKDAIQTAEEVTKQTKSESIFLVYGMEHDFKPCCNDVQIKHDFIPTLNDIEKKLMFNIISNSYENFTAEENNLNKLGFTTNKPTFFKKDELSNFQKDRLHKTLEEQLQNNREALIEALKSLSFKKQF